MAQKASPKFALMSGAFPIGVLRSQLTLDDGEIVSKSELRSRECSLYSRYLPTILGSLHDTRFQDSNLRQRQVSDAAVRGTRKDSNSSFSSL
ncbi:hypothetical protein J6590_077312 [Homalodisca vitripennis]|nr:hypothetical protein J6590_077312 [Homalodisca vitripennis]